MASPPDAAETTIRSIRPPEYPVGTFFERALDLVFPPTCVGCRRIGRWICDRCWPNTLWLGQTQCRGCGRVWLGRACAHCLGAESSLASLDAVTAFEGTAREAVHALKFEGQHAIAGLLARLLTQRAAPGVTILAPVPLHPSRRRERGYDQCSMLAQRTAKNLDVLYEPATLKRVRRTRQQALLSDPEERARNVAGAFETTAQVEREIILLIDDVTTSGATLEAAARALMDAGAAEVHGLVFSSARLHAPTLA